MLKLIENLAIILLSSCLGCALTATVIFLGSEISDCFTLEDPLRFCDLLSPGRIFLDVLPDLIIISTTFIVFGHMLAFPALLFIYLPVSTIFLVLRVQKIWRYLLVGTLAAAINGMFFNDKILIGLFALTGFFTSGIHYMFARLYFARHFDGNMYSEHDQ